jgi:hypothetical protein
MPNAEKALAATISELAKRGPDLTDMAHVDVPKLVQDLTEAGVVYAQFPGGDDVMVKGESQLRKIVAAGRAETLRLMCVRVANDEQRHMLHAALELIKEGKMDLQAIATFAAMLRDVQDVRE